MDARAKILDAALRLVRERGFAATSVDALCQAAGVTKGAFFHHFASKEALGVAAAEHWSATTSAFFQHAAYHDAADPLERVFAYLDLRAALIAGEVAEFTCVAGTMVSEVHASSPAIRDACRASIAGHADSLVADLAAALAQHGVGGVDAQALALHTQAVLQGGFILAKAQGDGEVARQSVGFLKHYIALLCGVPVPQKGRRP